MVAPQDPRAIAQRLRRLELLFFSLLVSLGDDDYDDHLQIAPVGHSGGQREEQKVAAWNESG